MITFLKQTVRQRRHYSMKTVRGLNWGGGVAVMDETAVDEIGPARRSCRAATDRADNRNRKKTMKAKSITRKMLAAALVLAAFNLSAATHYVSLQSTNPTPPYINWATAATHIQDAVDAAAPGDVILVTNGVYQTGARAVYGMSNRVAVTKPVTVRSVNGPAMTHIVGSGPVGPAAVRCVYLANEAVLADFTLTNGATQTSGDNSTNQSGGGVWCEGLSAVVSNCVITANSAYAFGGGAYSGTLNHCVISSNSAGVFADPERGGGGGAHSSALDHCTLKGNFAAYGGGGGNSSTLNHCVLSGNYGFDGGGANRSTLNHCSLTGNHSQFCGGAAYCTLNNCITYYNNAVLLGDNYDGSTLNYCCTTPLPTNGLGNIADAPLFVDTDGWSNLRLQTNSPCINAGNNACASGDADLDGNPRIAGATVDIGAYEFQGDGLSAFPAWLWQYGLRVDGSAEATDPDGDTLSAWQEWVCKTCPTNFHSALRLLSTARSGKDVQVTWQSALGVDYWVERATNLTSPFTLLATGIAGQAVTTSYADTNTAGGGRFFYRVGGHEPLIIPGKS